MKQRLRSLRDTKRFNVVVAAVFGVAVIVGGYAVVVTRAASGAATLSLSPATAIANNGTTFTVAVREDSGTAQVNAVQANLTYPTTALELVSIDASTSAFPLEAQSTGGSGIITLARAVNGGQPPLTGSQLVANITFKSLMTAGQATVTFAAGSAVVSSVDNTALLLTTNGGVYTPDTTAPTAPTGVHTTGATGTTINIAWTASTDNVAVTGYNVYRDQAKVGTVTTTSFGDTGLTMGTTHAYQVTAVDAAGNESAKSTVLNASTPDTVAPSVPAGLSVHAPAYNQVTLSWSAATDTGGSGLAGYRIYRNGSSTALASSATASYTDNSVSGSTAYTYTVSAYDGAGNESAKSTSAGVTTPPAPDLTPPTTPGSLHTTSTSLTSIALAWTASTDNVSVAGYQVFRNGALVASPTTTSYNDTGLSNGTNFTYTVKAKDPSGNISAAATVQASTLTLKVGDLNQDNSINILDLSILLSNWSGSSAADDLNHDGTVNIFDLSMLISNWGK